MDIAKLCEEALEIGFTLAEPMRVDTIHLREEVREMCAVNKCHAYQTNWSCPPSCGTIEECQERVNRYETGIIVETTGQLEDDFDFETMDATSKLHSNHFVEFLKKLRKEHPELDVLPLGAGECTHCKKCTYPDAPCRFPDKLCFSMEASGLVVNEVCTANGLKYNHGKDTICYTACFLLE
jgi:predicted metal-binding protein